MRVYILRDYTGCESTHLAEDFDAAVQAHLVHYGLLSLSGEIEQIDVKELKDVKDRDTVCWNMHCVVAGASDYEERIT